MSNGMVMNYSSDSIGPDTVEILNPVFDITPAQLVDVAVTEKDVKKQPDQQQIKSLMMGVSI